MKLTNVVLLIGFLSLMSAPAIAAEVEPPKFSDMDADGDTFITEAEFDKGKNEGVDKTFAEADESKDGKISEEEYEAIREPDCD